MYMCNKKWSRVFTMIYYLKMYEVLKNVIIKYNDKNDSLLKVWNV